VAEHPAVDVLPVVHRVEDGGGLLAGVRAHAGLGVVPAHAEGHDAERGQLGVLVEDADQRVVEDGTVVDAGTHDDLPVDLDAVVEQGPQPAQARGPAPVAQQVGAHGGVGGVDAHVERRQALGDDPLEVGLGEAGEGREVAVEERQAEVVVLQVEARPQPRRQLVDEAELAVVVTRAHLVEQRGVDLDAERLALGLGHLDGEHEAAATDVEEEVGVVGQELVGDDVPGHLAVHGEDLVAHEQPGALGRGCGRDSEDPRGRHGPPRYRSHPPRPPSTGAGVRPGCGRRGR
jgi:hypothetical protein